MFILRAWHADEGTGVTLGRTSAGRMHSFCGVNDSTVSWRAGEGRRRAAVAERTRSMKHASAATSMQLGYFFRTIVVDVDLALQLVDSTMEAPLICDAFLTFQPGRANC